MLELEKAANDIVTWVIKRRLLGIKTGSYRQHVERNEWLFMKRINNELKM